MSTTGTAAPLLRAEQVHKNYRDLEVLKGVDLEVRPGEVTCIIGPSGSGKSTFLRCINHLETIQYGRIWLGEELIGYRHQGGRLHELTQRELSRQRAGIGMVFQDFNLFAHFSALENVMAGPVMVKNEDRAQTRQLAETMLGQVGLADKMHAYPRHLSGGQQQRVAIARALAMRPALMLFDEPTSALDPELVSEVLDVIRDLVTQGLTMIIVTHEIGFAREIADTLVFMDAGIIVESGPPRDVISNPRQQRTRDFLSKVL